MPEAVRCALLPDHSPVLADAVADGGGTLVDVARAEGVIWTDPFGAGALTGLLGGAPQVRWVQLPFAGVEPFIDLLDRQHIWTCAKGAYAGPVAEHALALSLAGLRELPRRARAREWGEAAGQRLVGARVTILGGGGITRALLELLEPFRTETTVVRRHVSPVPGAARVVGPDEMLDALPGARLVILALALTPETRGVIGAEALDRMDGDAWLVNVARGEHVVTDDLVSALRAGVVGGAALDVTDPEPLPGGHPLWDLDNCLITPHVANPPYMAEPLLARRVRDNVERYAKGLPLLGLVDPESGY